jgi:hypothetical protein
MEAEIHSVEGGRAAADSVGLDEGAKRENGCRLIHGDLTKKYFDPASKGVRKFDRANKGLTKLNP